MRSGHRTWGRLIARGLILLLAAALTLVCAAAASAATITVSTTADETIPNDGHVSLREAINAINAGTDLADPDIAAARTGSYGSNDTVVVPANASHYTVSNTELTISNVLTIQGAGAGSTVIDGGNTNHRVFHITAAPASTSTVTFQGVTITGGHATSMPGGGAILVNFVSSSVALNLSIASSVITQNSAVVSTGAHRCCGGGGGIYGDGGGAITLTNSQVTHNTAAVTGSTASGTALACCDGGGGIYDNAVGPITLSGSSVSNNTATVSGPAYYCCHGGGGIYNDNGSTSPTLLSSQSSVSGNTFSLTGTQTDIAGTMGPGYIGNCCSGGGGIYQDNNSNVSLSFSGVDNNSSTINSGNCCHGGGAVYMDGGGALSVSASTENGNTATVNGPASSTGTHSLSHCCSGGGADAIFGSENIIASTLNGNASNVSSGDCCNGGGAIQIDSSLSLAVFGSTLSNNQSSLTGGTESGGGAVYDDTGASARNTYIDSTISDNSTNATTSQGGGGGLYVLNGNQTASDLIASTTIAGNAALSGYGGGILNDAGHLSAKNSIVALNTANTGGNCKLINATGPAFASLGYNLTDSPDSCGLTATGDKVVSAGSVGLGPLASNGGPTQTRALQSGSPAIDAGNPAGCTDAAGSPLTVDQRGYFRPDPGESSCDIGAFEFQDPPKHTLTVSKTGSGSGTVTSTDAGINCGSTCSHGYPQGTVVTLTATAASGSSFGGWSGAGCSGTSQCSVMMSGDQAVKATFTANPPPAKHKPSCTLVAKSDTILAHPKKKQKRLKGALQLNAKCDQAASLTLTGTLSSKKGRHKHTFALNQLTKEIAAGKTLTLLLKLPKGALAALKKGAAESVSLTLSAANANGVGTTTLHISHLLLG